MKKIDVYKGEVLLLEEVSELEDYLSGLEDGSFLTFDWETTGLDYDAIPLLLSLHQRGKCPVTVPVDYMFRKGLPMKDISRACNKEFRRLRLIAHNAKYDSMINVMNGIKDENCQIVADTLIMVHLYNPEIPKQLEKRVEADFGYKKKTFEEISGKKWAKINWTTDGDSLLELLAGYAGEDTYWTTKLYYKYKDLLDEDAWNILRKIEMPMVNILRDAKIRGVKINVPLLKDMEVEVTKRLKYIVDEIFKECGCVFNLNSPKQKQEIFFDKLKLPVISYTKKGGRSTDSGTAEEWAEMGYPIGKLLTEYSELNKLDSGYIKAIPNLVDKEDVLRGDINSCGTETGRCSSSNPNLQNQPNNSDFPIRKAFVPRPGYVFINYDYSQLELRVMAHMSKDKHFLEVFRNGEDPHGDVARRLGISRKGAKVVNFGVLYGMGPQKLARTIEVPESEAKKIITKDYMETYSGFAKWKEKTENFARKNGYVKNLFGRIRRLRDATISPDSDRKAFYGALRKAVNTKIQGTGADIVKIATIATVNEYKRRGLDAHFLLQVHDELLIEARIDQALEAEKILKSCMENSVKLDVPLDVDGKIILNWSEMKDDKCVSYPFRFDFSIYSGVLTNDK